MGAVGDRANIRTLTGKAYIVMRQRLVTTTLVPLLALAVSGCFPIVTRYHQLEGVGVEHRSSVCPSYGPPGRAEIKDGELSLTISLNAPGQDTSGSILLLIPLGARAEWGASKLNVVESGSGRTRILEMTQQVPTPRSPAMAGRVPTVQVLRYVFSVPIDLADEGTLVLPDMRFNDKVLPSRSFKYTRKTWVGLVPLNC